MSALLETFLSWLLPVFTIGMVLGVQLLFWTPSRKSCIETATTIGQAGTAPGPKIDDKDGAASSRIEPVSEKSSQTKSSSSYRGTEIGVSANVSSDKANEALELSSMKQAAANKTDDTDAKDDDVDDLFKMNNQWRCACEGGFLPPGMLRSLGGAEAMMRLGTGQCYHKQM